MRCGVASLSLCLSGGGGGARGPRGASGSHERGTPERGTPVGGGARRSAGAGDGA